VKPDAVQIRVLGALLEKQRTTPDTYPLTLNGLRAACNQTTNREPVVEYDEATIRHALEELGRRRWTRNVGGARAAKFRHMLVDALQITPPEQAVVAVLMLRGPQTPGELRQRTARLHPFADAEELEATIDGLVGRQLVVRLAKAPGQKEGRVQQVLGGDDAPAPAGSADTGVGTAAPFATPGSTGSRSFGSEPVETPGALAAASTPTVMAPPAAPTDEALVARVDQLEAELAELRGELAALRAELGA
jgi:uncharacterized protein YceH (UPF0502 family)